MGWSTVLPDRYGPESKLSSLLLLSLHSKLQSMVRSVTCVARQHDALHGPCFCRVAIADGTRLAPVLTVGKLARSLFCSWRSTVVGVLRLDSCCDTALPVFWGCSDIRTLATRDQCEIRMDRVSSLPVPVRIYCVHDDCFALGTI